MTCSALSREWITRRRGAGRPVSTNLPLRSKHGAPCPSTRPSLRSAATALLALLLLAWAATASAATVTATWDPNPESGIAGYVLSYGTQSGVYTTTVDVGNVTSWPLSLSPGQYYFAVRA